MSLETIELKVRKLIEPHYTRLKELRRTDVFKRSKKEFLMENYYLIGININQENYLKDWIVREMVLNLNDQLMIFDETTLNIFKDFKSTIYKGINQSLFDSINERTIKYDIKLTQGVKSSTRYKVIVLGLLNARFKSKLFQTIENNYPTSELILGFN